MRVRPVGVFRVSRLFKISNFSKPFFFVTTENGALNYLRPNVVFTPLFSMPASISLPTSINFLQTKTWCCAFGCSCVGLGSYRYQFVPNYTWCKCSDDTEFRFIGKSTSSTSEHKIQPSDDRFYQKQIRPLKTVQFRPRIKPQRQP